MLLLLLLALSCVCSFMKDKAKRPRGRSRCHTVVKVCEFLLNLNQTTMGCVITIKA